MATVTITIDTENTAFLNPNGQPHALEAGWEIGRILRRMADEFERDGSAGNPRDCNGNTVGTVKVG